MFMNRLQRSLLATAMSAGLVLTSTAVKAKDLTLCWAAWDPANALVELSKDFTAKSGINMKFEFVPWTSYADRFIKKLNSHGSSADSSFAASRGMGGRAGTGN